VSIRVDLNPSEARALLLIARQADAEWIGTSGDPHFALYDYRHSLRQIHDRLIQTLNTPTNGDAA
jgi:hypothetical protein